MFLVVGALALFAWGVVPIFAFGPSNGPGLDAQLSTQLRALGFTGRIESTLTGRLGPRRSTRGSRTRAGCCGSTRSPA